eukprot:SAG25_NODE_269_length_10643_cov_3.370982_8_plen_132_part_00
MPSVRHTADPIHSPPAAAETIYDHLSIVELKTLLKRRGLLDRWDVLTARRGARHILTHDDLQGTSTTTTADTSNHDNDTGNDGCVATAGDWDAVEWGADVVPNEPADARVSQEWRDAHARGSLLPASAYGD